jgi:hypothetical protein
VVNLTCATRLCLMSTCLRRLRCGAKSMCAIAAARE